MSVRVLDNLGGGLYTLSLKGRIFRASSDLNLKPDQVIRAAVERQQGIWKLKILPTTASAQAELTAPRALYSDPRFLLFAALLRTGSGLPEEAEALQRIAFLARTKGPKPHMARLYAELLNRGINPSAAFLEHFEALVSGRDSSGSGDSGQHARQQWEEVPDPEALSEDIGTDKDQDPLLDLFSQVPDRRGHWTIRRFRRYLGKTPLDMVVKYRHFGKPALALTIHDSGRVLEFLMEDIDPIRLNVYADEHTKISQELWQEFQHRISRQNVSVSSKIHATMHSDGFTAGMDHTLRELEERL